VLEGRLPGGDCRSHIPALRLARLFLQAARYLGQRCAWQLGAAAFTSQHSAVIGLSCRRLATAGNEGLGRWGLSLPLRRILQRSAIVLLAVRYRVSGALVRWGLPLPHPRFSLRSA